MSTLPDGLSAVYLFRKIKQKKKNLIKKNSLKFITIMLALISWHRAQKK